MRCDKQPRECPTSAVCEINGCQQPYAMPATALIPERQPIDLDYKPGRIMSALMRLQDKGPERARERAEKRPDWLKPLVPDFTPALSAPEPAPMAQPVPSPSVDPQPAPPVPAELRVVEVPGPAWLVYIGDKLLGMTQRLERLGPPR